MVMELLRVKGQHFDVGAESTLGELLEMDGLFVLKDIQNCTRTGATGASCTLTCAA